MKTFCGCVSTKTGSLAILAFYIVSFIHDLDSFLVSISSSSLHPTFQHIDIPVFLHPSLAPKILLTSRSSGTIHYIWFQMDEQMRWSVDESHSTTHSLYYTFKSLFTLQITAIGQVVLCSLKIDSGEYGKMQEENGLPEECLSADNNGTWWCKIIKNDDNSEWRW